MLNKFDIWLQQILPHDIVSRIAGKLAECRMRLIKNLCITVFAKIYHIDLSEAQETNSKNYEHFNAFFTRALKPGARPLPENPNIIVSPVDATIAQIGKIHDNALITAKSAKLSLPQLLADEHLAHFFAGGDFVTLYLSPSNYHRVHMPVAGNLLEMIHVPGQLFSVNKKTVAQIPDVFCRNERVVTIFETAIGKVAIILVGALIVGSIETYWEKTFASKQLRSRCKIWHYRNEIKLARGQELGRFKLGSTVIMVTAKNALKWADNVILGHPIKMGQELSSPDTIS